MIVGINIKRLDFQPIIPKVINRIAVMRKSILFTFLFLLLSAPAYTQTASILPLGRTQYFDNNGNPLSGGKVYNYIPGTTTFKQTWQDSGEIISNTNPVILDAAGRALIYGEGAYRQIVRKSNNDLVWDAVTSATGSGGGSSSTGDGDLVGTIKPWGGITAPNQYAFAYGQELLRASFPALLTAITLTTNVVCTSASAILSGIVDTTIINVGANVEVLCMAPGTTVLSKTSSSVTVSNNASISTNTSAVFFPYGSGNGSTTFNVPDLRGRVVAGRDNMGGVSSNRLQNLYYGTDPDAIGAAGGADNNTISIGQVNLPAVTLTTTIAAGQGAHTHTITGNILANASSGAAGGGNQLGTGTTLTANSNTLPAMTGATPLGGSGTGLAFGVVQPTMTLNYIIKVTPDTNSSISTGVTSLGLMTGDIACGSGLLCTGNTISVTGALTGFPLTTVDDTNITLALGGTPATSLLNAVSVTAGWSGLLSLSRGGTNTNLTPVNGAVVFMTATGFTKVNPDSTPNRVLLSGNLTTGTWSTVTYMASGNSGGVPYFSAANVMATSLELTANQIVIGGGAGGAPSTFLCATTTTVVHGGTPPSCSQIVAADVTTNTLTNATLAQMAAVTIKGNPTSGTTNATDFTIAGLTARGAPDATNDQLLLWDSAAGTLKKVTPGEVAAAATAGVSSLGGVTGAITLGSQLTMVASQLTLATTTGPTVQVLTATGTYTAPALMVKARVYVKAGGASGGGSSSATANGGGGGEGAESWKWLSRAAVTGQTCTIGAAGAAIALNTNSMGNVGGNTCVGGATCTSILVSAVGGAAGNSGNVGGAGGVGGANTGTHDWGMPGSPGQIGANAAATVAQNSCGGGKGAGCVGVNAIVNSGGGGSGGSTSAGSGAGASGICVFEEYYQ